MTLELVCFTGGGFPFTFTSTTLHRVGLAVVNAVTMGTLNDPSPVPSLPSTALTAPSPIRSLSLAGLPPRNYVVVYPLQDLGSLERAVPRALSLVCLLHPTYNTVNFVMPLSNLSQLAVQIVDQNNTALNMNGGEWQWSLGISYA